MIDDDIFEEDEYFYVHLSNPRLVGYPENCSAPLEHSTTPKAVLGDAHTATVTIYDDDHAGKKRPHPRPMLVGFLAVPCEVLQLREQKLE